MAQPDFPTLYNAAFEHDSCGFGLVAQIDGHASAWVVDTAFDALAKLSHRGGVNADGISGDGCGVLIHRPQSWLRAMAKEAGIALGETFAAGVVFLVYAARKEEGLDGWFRLDSPATPERLRMACADKITAAFAPHDLMPKISC